MLEVLRMVLVEIGEYDCKEQVPKTSTYLQEYKTY